MLGGLDDEDEGGVIAEINMIPFIDISLVLLIIFLVTSSIIVRETIEVQLPQAASGSETAPSTVGIAITNDGALYWNGERSNAKSIGQSMRKEADADPKVRAIISADRDVDYGVVVDVIDIVKQNGASAFALNVEQRAAAPTSESPAEDASTADEDAP